MIGIVIADDNELSKLHFDIIETKKVNAFDVTIFDLNGKEVAMVHSGIGVINSAATAQMLISSLNVTHIYNYGAVGTLDDHNVFDIVIPSKILFYDVYTPWYKRGQFPREKEFYTIEHKDVTNHTIGTGSKFLDKIEEAKQIKEELGATIFDMECAAIAAICDKNNIPFLSVKSVSDIIGKDSTNLGDINSRISEAGKLSLDKLLEIIK